MDAANRFDRTVDHTSSWSLLPLGGHARPAEVPKESSFDCPEMRYDRILGPGFFTREDFLDFYGDADGASLWARARVYDSGDSPYDTSGCPDAETQDTDDDAERPCALASPPGPSAFSGRGLGTHRVAGSSIPRDCRSCGKIFLSGNALFRHLNDAHACPCAPGSPPGSSDPSADDSPTSDSGGPELRSDDHPDDHGLYTRGEFLAYYGDADGAARWERAPKQRFDDSPCIFELL